MSRPKTTTALAITAGVVTLGAGIGVASLASADPTPLAPASASPTSAPTTSAPKTDPDRPGFGGPGGRHGFGGQHGQHQAELAQQLAKELGVSQDKVTKALQEIRDENRPAVPPTPGATRPDPTQREAGLAKSLAGKLGVDQAKVKAALQKFRAAERAERAGALKTRLDAAVKAGTLTRAEADAVTKAYERGVINVGPR